MFSFNSLANITQRNVPCYLTLQARPPKSLPQIQIHLGIPGMNLVRSVMCLMKNQLPDVLILRYTNALLKPNGSMLILMETLGFASAHVPLYCLNLGAVLLGSSDPLQQV